MFFPNDKKLEYLLEQLYVLFKTHFLGLPIVNSRNIMTQWKANCLFCSNCFHGLFLIMYDFLFVIKSKRGAKQATKMQMFCYTFRATRQINNERASSLNRNAST